jgi:hypothetical protein
VNERVRSVLFGLGIGLAVLLLLDLARILSSSVGPDATSPWWVVAAYSIAGIVVGAGVVAGRRERLIPLLAAVLVGLVALPTVDPNVGLGWYPVLPFAPDDGSARAVAFAAVGAFAYGAIRGPQA